MSNDPHPSPLADRSLKVRIVAELVALLVVVGVGGAVVLLLGGGLVWTTSSVETWLDLPPMSLLIAVVGLLLIATVLVAQGRIVRAIHDTRWGPFDMLREYLERNEDEDEDEDDDDDDDDDAPAVRRRR